MADKKKKPKPGDAIVSVNITKDVNGLARMVTTYESGLVTDETYSLPGRGTGGSGSPFFRGKPIIPDSVGAKIAENKLNNKVIVSIANERIKVMADQMKAAGELKKLTDAFTASGDAALSIAQAVASWKPETAEMKSPGQWTSMVQSQQEKINRELENRPINEVKKFSIIDELREAQAGWDKGTSAKPDETKVSLYDKDGNMTADLTAYIKTKFIERPVEEKEIPLTGAIFKSGEFTWALPGAGFAGQFNKTAADFERSEAESKAAPRELDEYRFRVTYGQPQKSPESNLWLEDLPFPKSAIITPGETMVRAGLIRWYKLDGGYCVRYPEGGMVYYTDNWQYGKLQTFTWRIVQNDENRLSLTPSMKADEPEILTRIAEYMQQRDRKDRPLRPSRPERYDGIVMPPVSENSLARGGFEFSGGFVRWFKVSGGYVVLVQERTLIEDSPDRRVAVREYPARYYTDDGRRGVLREIDNRIIPDQKADYVFRQDGMSDDEIYILKRIADEIAADQKQWQRQRMPNVFTGRVEIDRSEDPNVDKARRERALTALASMRGTKSTIIVDEVKIGEEPTPKPDPFWDGLDFSDQHSPPSPLQIGFDNIELE